MPLRSRRDPPSPLGFGLLTSRRSGVRIPRATLRVARSRALPEGFEPPIAVPKTAVISVSPRERTAKVYITLSCADTGNRSQIFCSPPLVKFCDPGSRSPSADGDIVPPFDPPSRRAKARRLSRKSPWRKDRAQRDVGKPRGFPDGGRGFVRIRGIEPRSRPWQGRVLPLNHIRNAFLLQKSRASQQSGIGISTIHRNRYPRMAGADDYTEEPLWSNLLLRSGKVDDCLGAHRTCTAALPEGYR